LGTIYEEKESIEIVDETKAEMTTEGTEGLFKRTDVIGQPEI